MSAKSSINPIDILTRLDWTESEELELKAAKGGLPKSLWESYSALARSRTDAAALMQSVLADAFKGS